MAYLYSDAGAYLWTMGYVPRLDTYPGWEVPNPLAVDVLRASPLTTIDPALLIEIDPLTCFLLTLSR
jgi:hypothetical protein